MVEFVLIVPAGVHTRWEEQQEQDNFCKKCKANKNEQFPSFFN